MLCGHTGVAQLNLIREKGLGRDGDIIRSRDGGPAYLVWGFQCPPLSRIDSDRIPSRQSHDNTPPKQSLPMIVLTNGLFARDMSRT